MRSRFGLRARRRAVILALVGRTTGKRLWVLGFVAAVFVGRMCFGWWGFASSHSFCVFTVFMKIGPRWVNYLKERILSICSS